MADRSCVTENKFTRKSEHFSVMQQPEEIHEPGVCYAVVREEVENNKKDSVYQNELLKALVQEWDVDLLVAPCVALQSL